MSQESDLFPALECLLFASADPVTPEQVAAVLQLEPARAGELLEAFSRQSRPDSGLRVARVAGGFTLRTRPEFEPLVTQFLRPTPQRLSRQALETLAIIAYEQPVTLPEIEAIRGVASDGVLRTLGDRGLIREAGRKETVGRPILYATTDYFLRHFGLNNLGDLPERGGETEIEDLEI